MNRNFTALCAALLAFALTIASFGGVIAESGKRALADTNESSVKKIYLTFDDGPSDRVTPKILDVLAEEEVKATFFIVGIHAETRKYLLERMYAEGHTLGVHSYTHKYGEIYSSAQSLLQDIDRCNGVIKSVTGEYSTVYRFPGGSFGLPEELISAVTAHGMRYVDWNASARDAEICCAAPEQLLKAATTTAACADNIVLLAHDSTTKVSTADALKDIIRHFKSEGYVFKTF